MTSRKTAERAFLAMAVLCGLAVLLNGCAALDGEPRYQNKTIRTLPATSAGKQCLNQCTSTRLQCESNIDATYDRCERDRDRRDRDCKREASSARAYCLRNRALSCDLSYSNKLSLCRSQIQPCTRNAGRCDRLDSLCFERCGGAIRTERVCVQNCEKIGKPAR